MELTNTLKTIFIETAKRLKGSERRLFMAQVVKSLGKGGQRRAEAELGWHRRTIRNDIKAIVEAESQTDPTFKTTRLYIRLSAAEVRKQLIVQKGYSDEQLPSQETIRTKLNKLGYHLKKVKKVNR
jgi:hypothetical protein